MLLLLFLSLVVVAVVIVVAVVVVVAVCSTLAAVPGAELVSGTFPALFIKNSFFFCARSALASANSNCISASKVAGSLYSGVIGAFNGSPSNETYVGFSGLTTRSVRIAYLTVSA